MIRQAKDRAVELPGDGGQFVEAYVDANGRQNSVDTGSTDATFDTDKYKADGTGDDIIYHAIPTGLFSPTISSSFLTFDPEDWESGANIQYKLTNDIGPHVEIEASSISSVSDFEINDCAIYEVSSGKWLLWATSGTDEEKRAKIYKTLFYGTNGTNPRASSTYITSITALRTTVSRDVDKKAFYVDAASTTTSGCSATWNFSNTTTNNDCSLWSVLSGQTVGGADIIVLEFPTGTKVLDRFNDSSDIGEDTSSDEQNNPADVYWDGGAAGDPKYADFFVLCEGGLSLNTSSNVTQTITDFNTDNSIPAFTASTVTTGDDSGWLTANEIVSFTDFSFPPLELQVKLIPKSTSPTAGYPAIRGVYLHGTRPA
jgi:hypothetical protein